MIIDREKLIEIIESWLTEITPGRIIYSISKKEPHPENVENNRIIIPITGNLWLNVKKHNQVKTIVAKRGDIIYCSQYGLSQSLSKEYFSNLAIVFFPEFIRFVYYIYDETKTFPLKTPDIYYHTAIPIFIPGKLLLSTINELSLLPVNMRKGEVELMKALILFSLTNLKANSPEISGKALSTWQLIVDYINENCGEPISRSSIAEKFQLSGCYLSVLCKRFTGKKFSDYLTELRLERATMLLLESNLLLDEIASNCGFRYTTYFIRVFQRFYQISPAKYRVEWRKM